MNEETFEDIFDWLNRAESKFEEQLTERLRKAHPTLQQCFVRSVLKVFKAHSERPYTDARNKVSVDLCKQITELVGDTYIPFI